MLRYLVVAALLVGCASNAAVDDDAATSDGASTSAVAIAAGTYDGHMPDWDGTLTLSNPTDAAIDFDFEVSPNEDVAPIGTLTGTAKRTSDGFAFDDGSCQLSIRPEGANLDIIANAACGLNLGIDGHDTSQTAFDLSSTWLAAQKGR